MCKPLDAVDRENRCRMMHARDVANFTRHKVVAWPADQILSTIEQLGMAYAASQRPAHEIKIIREYMAELYRVAAGLASVLGDEA